MKPPLEHGPPGSPQDWLVHAESDLNLARIAQAQKNVLRLAESVFAWASGVIGP